MRPAHIDGTTKPHVKPDKWNDSVHGRCGTLHVREEMKGDVRFMKSAWEVSADEAGWLLAGSSIHLGISAPQHPVVDMDVSPMPEDSEPVWTIRKTLTREGQSCVFVKMFCAKGTVWCENFINPDPPISGRESLAVAGAMEKINEKARQMGIL